MVKIGLEVTGMGYSGVSGGGLGIYVIKNDYHKKFSGFCQGVSSSKIHIYDLEVKNEVEGWDESVLLDLNLFDLKLEIPTPFGLYNPVELTLQLFERNSSEPIFKTTRRPSAWGFSLGSVSILSQAGQMSVVQKGSWSDYQNQVGQQLKEEVRRDMRVASMY